MLSGAFFREDKIVAEIKKYRKPLNLNIGIIIFAAIFIYACFYIGTYFKTNHIRPYEVREGSLTSNNLYTGIAVREENVVYADATGYINYYVKEGGRAANGDLVYSIDETGKLNEYINLLYFYILISFKTTCNKY